MSPALPAIVMLRCLGCRASNISPQLRCQALAHASRAYTAPAIKTMEGSMNAREREEIIDIVGDIDAVIEYTWGSAMPWEPPEHPGYNNVGDMLRKVRDRLKELTAGD
jgi:hypothetical protein